MKIGLDRACRYLVIALAVILVAASSAVFAQSADSGSGDSAPAADSSTGAPASDGSSDMPADSTTPPAESTPAADTPPMPVSPVTPASPTASASPVAPVSSSLPAAPAAGAPAPSPTVGADTVDSSQATIPSLETAPSASPENPGSNVPLFAGAGAVVLAGIGLVAAKAKKNSKKKDKCTAIKQKLDTAKAGVALIDQELSMQDVLRQKLSDAIDKKKEDLKEQAIDAAKEKALEHINSEALSKAAAKAESAKEAYDDLMDKKAQAEKMIAFLKAKREKLAAKAEMLEASYSTCMLGASASGASAPDQAGIDLPDTEKSSLTIKQAVISDIPTLLQVEKIASDKGNRHRLHKEEEWNDEFQKGSVYMIEKDGKPVGNLFYEQKAEDHIFIKDVVIDPALKESDVAKEALSQLFDALKNIRTIDLAVHPDDKELLGLYQSLGFAAVSQEENYFPDGTAGMLLRRTAIS